MDTDPVDMLKAAVSVGIGATVITDLWALANKRAFGIPPPNYCLVGRWLCHMPSGTFRHNSITAAPRKKLECTVGWIAHYAIGAIFALMLMVLASPRWLQEPPLMPAVLTGLATVVFPFFVMQPSFGQGIAAAMAPNPIQARLRSLANHVIFGFGLYVSAIAVSYFDF